MLDGIYYLVFLKYGFRFAKTLRRFWTMLAHSHGQMLNASKIGQSLGFSSPTIRGYLDIMAQTFMVRVLPPFHANVKKRLIKSPKVYRRDSGILHALLEIEKGLWGQVLSAAGQGRVVQRV